MRREWQYLYLGLLGGNLTLINDNCLKPCYFGNGDY